MKDRALTAPQKRAIVERLYAAWLAVPEQRLGQLLVNAAKTRCKAPLFYAEDEALIDAAESFAVLCVGVKK